MELQKDMGNIENADVFIYQHCRKESLQTALEIYTPTYLIDNVIKPSCKKISLPSIYFNADFIDPIRSTCDEFYLPKYTINRFVYDAVMDLKMNTLDVVEHIQKIEYTEDEIKAHIERAFENLGQREIQNDVTIKVTPFLRKEYLKRRLMHTTNHPNKYVFNYLVNEVLKHLNLPEDETILLRKDLMVKHGHQFILPCVKRYYSGRIDDDFIFSGHGVFFSDISEYIHLLKLNYRNRNISN